MTTHCGQKFVCHNVFRSLFLSNWKQSLKHERAMSTSMTAHKPPVPPTLYEYNKLLISHAKTFKKNAQGQLDAVAVLEEMKKNGVQPNSQSYIQLIIRLAWKRHRSYKQNERLEGWVHDFLSQMNVGQNKRHIPKVKKVMQSLSTRGHPRMKSMFLKSCEIFDDLGVECWNAAIAGCLKAKELGDAEELLNMARNKKIANNDSYELLMESFLHFRDQKSASRIFSYMLQDRIAASCTMYEKFVEYYITLPPNIETFETLEKLWQAIVMTSAKDNNIPDKIIKSMLEYFRLHDRLPAAEQMLLDIKTKQQKLNRECLGQAYEVIMLFARKQQLLSALSLYYDLIGDGYRPSSKVTCKLIQTAKAMKDKEVGHQLLKITKELNPDANLSQSCYDLLLDNDKIK